MSANAESTQLPAFAVLVLQVLVSFGAMARPQMDRIPVQFFPDPVSHVAQQGRFSERTRIVKTAGGRPTGFAGLDPFLVMTNRVFDEWLRRGEVGKILLRQQDMTAVVGEQHA